MTKKLCANCVFFWSGGEVMADGPFKGAQRGECLVNPPQLQLVPSGARPTFGPGGMGAQQEMRFVGMSPSTLSARPACKEHHWSEEKINKQHKWNREALQALQSTSRAGNMMPISQVEIQPDEYGLTHGGLAMKEIR